MAKEAVGVNKENIFEVMVSVHYQNLLECLPYFSGGKILGLEGEELEEGRDEVPHYKGQYLVYDGPEVLNTIAERLARKKNPFKESISVPDKASFLERVCAGNKNTDVVLGYNTAEKTITPIKSEFCNDVKDMDQLLETHLPYNFASADGSVSVYEVGTKTASAALNADVLNHPQDKGLRALLVKRTAYGDLRMGKIAEFGPEGLTREFFFEYAPEHTGPFVDEERKIIGVLRDNYHHVDGELVPQNEYYVSFSPKREVLYTPVSDAVPRRAYAAG
jgi:hypothetical protein